MSERKITLKKSRPTKFDRRIRKNFLVVVSISLVVMILQLINNTSSINQFIFHDTNDYFMDFYNSIYHANNNPYALRSIYPPFTYLIYKFFSIFISNDIISQGSLAIRDSQGGNIAFMVFQMSSFIPLILGVNNFINGIKLDKAIFTGIVLLTSPFLFAYERGNIIILSLVLLMIFVFMKDSESKILREVSFICLAMSACIKVYPALFGLLLIKDKRYKDAIRTIVYGILIFFVPFIFFGGISSIVGMLEGIVLTTDMFSMIGFGYLVDLGSSLRLLFNGILGIDGVFLETISKVLPYVLLISGCVCLWAIKKEWKQVCLLTTLIVLVPGFSWTYVLVFFIIPLIMFINEENKNKRDYIYLLFFILIFGSWPTEVISSLSWGYPVSGNQILQMIGTLGLNITLMIEGMYNIFKYIKRYMKSKKSSSLRELASISREG